MPTPKPSERKPEFIQRCVPQLIGEGKTTDEAVAICYSIFSESKKMMRTKKVNTRNLWDYWKLNKNE